jgi:hypothetical protein
VSAPCGQLRSVILAACAGRTKRRHDISTRPGPLACNVWFRSPPPTLPLYHRPPSPHLVSASRARPQQATLIYVHYTAPAPPRALQSQRAGLLPLDALLDALQNGQGPPIIACRYLLLTVQIAKCRVTPFTPSPHGTLALARRFAFLAACSTRYGHTMQSELWWLS